MLELTVDIQEAMDALTYIDTSAIISNKEMKKKVIAKIQPIRRAVRKEFVGRLKGNPRDPRNMARGVNGVIFRKVIGGTVSILNAKRPESVSYVVPKGGKSGKPRQRYASADTIRMQEAWGRDRVFIMRWINEGKTGQPHPARGFFDIAAPLARKASHELAMEVVELIEKIHKKHTT